MLSWRQLKGPKKGEILGTSTKRSELTRFRTFLNYCIDSEYIGKSAAKTIRVPRSRNNKRYGLELDEYDRLLETPVKGTDMDKEIIAAAMLRVHSIWRQS
jgi:site-specific recombinase XerD